MIDTMFRRTDKILDIQKSKFVFTFEIASNHYRCKDLIVQRLYLKTTISTSNRNEASCY